MADEGELAVDHSRKEIAEMLVFLRKPYIRPYLSSGIPEPHGVDVTGIHECSPVPVLVLAEMNGGVESVREAVCKHTSILNFHSCTVSYHIDKLCGMVCLVKCKITGSDQSIVM